MSTTMFRPETDGYLFSNSWIFDDTELSTLRGLVSDAVGAVEIILSPIILAALGPAIIAEAGIPFVGPWLVYKTVKKINDDIVGEIVNAIDAKPYGLCGGMAFSSLDYWLKRWVVPQGVGPDDQPQRTSASGTTLRNYIWRRLIESLESNAGTFLEWMAVLHLPIGPGASWLCDQTKGQLATLKVRIDRGTPVTIGLVGTTKNPLSNHQVLCYGYTDNPDGTCTLFLYDNNNPGNETTTTLDLSGSTLSAVESFPSDDRGPLRGFFCTQYGPTTPPVAVALSSGLTVAPPSSGVGEPFEVNFSATNIGYHTSTPLQLIAAGNDGTLVEDPAPKTIAEGDTRSLSGSLSFVDAGAHQIFVVALVTVAGFSSIKQLPPRSASQSDEEQVVVTQELSIWTVADVNCYIANRMGVTAWFVSNAADVATGSGIWPALLTYKWVATGAIIQSGENEAQVTVKMPDEAGTAVTLTVKVTLPDGGLMMGTISFKILTEQAAQVMHDRCELLSMHIVDKMPWLLNPNSPDPGPDGEVSIDPGELAGLRAGLATLASAIGEASEATGGLTLAPTVASTFTSRLLGQVDDAGSR